MLNLIMPAVSGSRPIPQPCVSAACLGLVRIFRIFRWAMQCHVLEGRALMGFCVWWNCRPSSDDTARQEPADHHGAAVRVCPLLPVQPRISAPPYLGYQQA